MTSRMEHQHEAEHQQADGNSTPHCVRTVRANAREQEEISPVFGALNRQATHLPTAAQWREFKQSLDDRLGQKSRGFSWRLFAQTCRDRVTATDSSALRLLFFMAIAAAVALAALIGWVMAETLMPTPVRTPVAQIAATDWTVSPQSPQFRVCPEPRPTGPILHG